MKPGFYRLSLILPLLVISYLTFKTAMGRVEDSNRHLSELNRLYLSTIESLAMAMVWPSSSRTVAAEFRHARQRIFSSRSIAGVTPIRAAPDSA